MQYSVLSRKYVDAPTRPKRRPRWFLIAMAISVISCSDSGTEIEEPDPEKFLRNYAELCGTI